MTGSEDIKRVVNTDIVDFLNARIEALESRVEYLEIQNQWIEQEFNISNLNK
jgi:chaperonin cofactor prefoldin